MTAFENTQRRWQFTQLKWSLQALAMAASDQLGLFPELVAKADELAFEFAHCASVVRQQYERELTGPQAGALGAIDQQFAAMAKDGAAFDRELWTETGLRSSLQWERIRTLATSALELFGWPVESPDRNPT